MTRIRALLDGKWSLADLVRLHTTLKMELLSHHPGGYRALGRLVARAALLPRAQVSADYLAGAEAVLAIPVTRGGHANALQHMAGHLRGRASETARREVARAIEDYRRGLADESVPRELFSRLARRHGIAYLAAQTALERR